MNSTWGIIIGAALVSYFLRVMPFLLSRVMKPIPERGVEFLETVSFGIIGGLVAESLLGGGDLQTRGLACILAFCLAFLTQKPSLIFYVIFIGFYFIE